MPVPVPVDSSEKDYRSGTLIRCQKHLHEVIQSDTDDKSHSMMMCDCSLKCSRRYLSWVWAPAAVVRTFQSPRCPPGWTCYVWWRPGGSQTRWPSQWTLWPPRRLPLGRFGRRTGRSAHPARTRYSPAAAHIEEGRECRHQLWKGGKKIIEGEELCGLSFGSFNLRGSQ